MYEALIPKEKLMKKRISVTLLSMMVGICAVCCTGCPSPATWWQNFQSNPVAGVQAFDQIVQVVLLDAEVAFQSIEGSLPVATQVQITAAYTAAVAKVNDTLALLADGVQIAIDAQNPLPTFAALVQAVSNAATDLVTLVNSFKTQQLAAGNLQKTVAYSGFAEMNSALTVMKHVGHTK
jgi:hypothetical protein